MIDRYRAGVLPAAGDLEQIDRDLLAHGEKLPAQLAAAYDRIDLQQCAELPVQLARLTNGYIDATEPFKLAKDASQATRLNTVLNVAAHFDPSVSGGPAADPSAKSGRGIVATENRRRRQNAGLAVRKSAGSGDETRRGAAIVSQRGATQCPNTQYPNIVKS